MTKCVVFFRYWFRCERIGQLAGFVVVQRGLLSGHPPHLLVDQRIRHRGGDLAGQHAAPDALRRLAALLPAQPVLAEQVASRFRLSGAQKKRLALAAFSHTAMYDAAVAQWLAEEISGSNTPERITRSYQLLSQLRYGENSHQSAAIYLDSATKPGVANALQLGGKEMSYNNYVDAVIQLPSDLFFGTGIATCILVLKKSKKENSTLFVDASALFTRAQTKNKLMPDHMSKILETVEKLLLNDQR